jgi:hypothetical protein
VSNLVNVVEQTINAIVAVGMTFVIPAAERSRSDRSSRWPASCRHGVAGRPAAAVALALASRPAAAG